MQNKTENQLTLELYMTELIWEACSNAKFDSCKQISLIQANIWLLI